MPSTTATIASIAPDVDAEQASRHLEVLHRGASPDAFLSLVLLKSPRRERHAFARIADLARVSGQAARDSIEHLDDVVRNADWNLYTACATFRRVPDKGRGTREDVDTLPGVWCDLDVKPGVEDYFQTENQLAAFLYRMPPTTMEVASGSGGRHAYWLLKERIDMKAGTKLLPAWLDFLRAEADGAVIENVQDSARILRLAGTVRWPKIDDAQATTARPVILLKDDGPRYHLGELTMMSQSAATEAQARREEITLRRTQAEQARIDKLVKIGLRTPDADQLRALFNQYANWFDLLTPHGWTLFSDQRDGAGRCRYWVRPHKDVKDGKSASTDFINEYGFTSNRMTIYSQDPSLLPLWENTGSSDAHGLCSKFHFSLIMNFKGDLPRLLEAIYDEAERGGWVLRHDTSS